MDHKKITKRTVGIAAAAALTLTATGAAYAATDGSISEILDRITFYINGEEAEVIDYSLTADENGDPQFTIPMDSEGGNPVTVTLSPEDGAVRSDVAYSINIDKDGFAAEAEDIPFSLEAENGRLYLIEENGDRLDVTEAAASPNGYLFEWPDKDGHPRQAIATGTPEEHSIILLARSAEANVAVEAN